MLPVHTPRSALLVALLATSALAGCVHLTDQSTHTDDVVDPLADFVDPMLVDDHHIHGDRAHHANLSWNMEEIGWTNMVDGLSVAWGEIDTHGDLAVVAYAYPTAGFATVDISDPASPRVLDTYETGAGYGADVKFSTDGARAFVAVQDHGDPQPLAGESPIAGTVAAGIHVYDVSDPTNIVLESVVPVEPSGVHMLYVHEIWNNDHIFAAHNLEGVAIYEFYDDSPAPHMRQIALIEGIEVDGTNIPVRSAHDMTVIHDPVLKTPVLYVADAFAGVAIYDVGEPLRPEAIGHWDDDSNEWYVHTVQARTTADGQRTMVVVPEVFSNAEATVVSPLWVLDATDFSDIRLSTTWNAPGDHGADLLRFSVHNFQFIDDDRLVLAHYHGGVWVLQLSRSATTNNASGIETTSIDLTTPLNHVTPLGYHVPNNDPGWPMSGIYHGQYNMEDAPTVWDVVVHDGIIWATDVNSGLYALSHEAIASGTFSLG